MPRALMSTHVKVASTSALLKRDSVCSSDYAESIQLLTSGEESHPLLHFKQARSAEMGTTSSNGWSMSHIMKLFSPIRYSSLRISC